MVTAHCPPFPRSLLAAILITGMWFGLLPGIAAGQDDPLVTTHDPHPSVAPVSPLKRLQRFVSRADGDRCPMYPTCSHYAAQAFAQEGPLKGWVLTCDRLLRCGRDETRQARPIRVQGRQYAYDPLDANTFWWKAR